MIKIVVVQIAKIMSIISVTEPMTLYEKKDTFCTTKAN